MTAPPYEQPRRHSATSEEPPGGKDRHRPGCGAELLYCFDFDAAYCPSCDVWTERACSDPVCEYCSGRPEQPSSAHLPALRLVQMNRGTTHGWRPPLPLDPLRRGFTLTPKLRQPR